MLTARITIGEGKPEVEFEGVWTRAMIEVAARLMLRELPAYIAELRKKEGQQNEKRRRQKS